MTALTACLTGVSAFLLEDSPHRLLKTAGALQSTENVSPWTVGSVITIGEEEVVGKVNEIDPKSVDDCADSFE